MLKKTFLLLTILFLFSFPVAQAGGFSGGSSSRSSSFSSPSVSRSSSTFSTPSSSSTYSSKGSFSNSTTTKPSTPPTSGTYSSKGSFSNTTNTRPTVSTGNTYKSAPIAPSSNVSRVYPSSSYQQVHWYTPSTWHDGFTSGVFLGSMMHPWGGYYGGGAAYGYYGWSIGALILDVFFLCFFIWLIWFCFRPRRRY